MLSKKTFTLSLEALCLSLALAICAWAQTANSRISGTVADATGAVVSGARVTAKNEATGVTYTQATTSAGLYAFPSLPVGRYTITIEMNGFKTTNQVGMVLQVDTPLVVDVTLEVGQASEVVNVEGSFEKLQTANATIGNVVEQKAIEQLPLNGRNPLSLITLEAGVTQGSAGAGSNTISVNGSRDPALYATSYGSSATTTPVPPAPNTLYRPHPPNTQKNKKR